MNAVDFTNSIEKVCEYGGSEKKKKIIYNGEVYLLKFPDPIREKNMPLSYINNVFSEYIGCKIFESVNIPVQKVILGIYNEKQEKEVKQKVVVACKDFTNEKQKHKGYDCQRKSFRVYGAFCICSARNYIFYVSFAQKHIKSSPPENKDNLHCQYGGCGKRVLFKIVNIFFAVGDNFIFHFFFFL